LQLISKLGVMGSRGVSIKPKGGYMAEFIGGVIGLILVIVPLWRICARAGFSPALSLLAIIPWLGFLIVAVVLGFSEWPATRTHGQP
jgi:hypothetical protein